MPIPLRLWVYSPQGLTCELARVDLGYLLAPSQTSHMAYNNTPLKPGIAVSNGDDVLPTA
jgi:hypothetical protein